MYISGIVTIHIDIKSTTTVGVPLGVPLYGTFYPRTPWGTYTKPRREIRPTYQTSLPIRKENPIVNIFYFY